MGVDNSAPEVTLGDMLEECPENAGPSEADRGDRPVDDRRPRVRRGFGGLYRLCVSMDQWLGTRLSDAVRWHMSAAGWGVMIGLAILTLLVPFII